MADPVQAGTAQPSSGRQPGEPDGLSYRLTSGRATALQRPGGIPGTASGGEGDPGRTGLARLISDDALIPPHTGV
jgi:hypothetical protein